MAGVGRGSVKSGKDEQNWATWMKSGSKEHKILEAGQVLRTDRKDNDAKEGQRKQKCKQMTTYNNRILIRPLLDPSEGIFHFLYKENKHMFIRR